MQCTVSASSLATECPSRLSKKTRMIKNSSRSLASSLAYTKSLIWEWHCVMHSLLKTSVARRSTTSRDSLITMITKRAKLSKSKMMITRSSLGGNRRRTNGGRTNWNNNKRGTNSSYSSKMIRSQPAHPPSSSTWDSKIERGNHRTQVQNMKWIPN